MNCGRCGAALPAAAAFCVQCGAPTSQTATVTSAGHLEAVNAFLQEVADLSLRDLLVVDRARALDILRSPVFLLLSFVAVVPLAIQSLESTRQILNALAIWSGLLWALLLYRLFAARQVRISFALGVVFFTAFIGIPLLQAYLAFPVNVFERFTGSDTVLPLRLVAMIFGVGVREEVFKAIPLLLCLWLAPAVVAVPIAGVVLGMMSGVGFAIAENVHYVFSNLSDAIGAVQRTGNLGHLVAPIYTNVVRMAMTPFFHGCLAGITGYFISLGAADPARRKPLLVGGLLLAATLHGAFDTFVDLSPLWGVLIEVGTFFIVFTYVLKAHGLTSATSLGKGLFEG